MPGSRLSQQDREYIARALTDKLGYAEIARRLNRPTSTISREIGRNGGPDEYRADRAEQAARQRGQRRGPGVARTTGDPASGRPPQPAAVREFEEAFAAMMVQTGFPRMMARVLVALFISDSGSLTATELVQRLRVSPASVSKAVRYLEHLRFVTRQRAPGERRERYVVGEDIWYRAWSARAQTFATWADTARVGAETLGVDTPAGARLAEMGEFFGLVLRDISRITEEWRRFLASRQPGDAPDPGTRDASPA